LSLSTNTDYVREWTAAWNRGDVDALIEDVDPDFEWVVAREHPDPTAPRGIDEVGAYLRDWLDTMPDLQVEIVDLEEIGDRVLSVLKMKGTGTGSGATTEVVMAVITTFRDRTPVRTEEFLDPEEARRVLDSG
jgi:ketosteroid isomerase-like protein